MKMLPPCPKCGSLDHEFRWQGISYSFRCAYCHEGGATTTCFPPFRTDQGPYTIIVTELGPDPSRTLIALNRRFTHGIRRTRELFSAGEQALFTGDASSVWTEAQRLLSNEVPFRIEPAYPYDLATFDPLHAHEHDWLPISPDDL